MYIGKLSFSQNIRTVRPDSDVPFFPSSLENGMHKWSWNTLYDSTLDVILELDSASYVGAVCINLPDNSVKSISALVDGKLCGKVVGNDSLIGGEITVEAGAYGKTVTIRIACDFQDVFFSSSDIEILGATDGDKFIWPTPKVSRQSGEYFKFKDIVAENSDEDEIFAAKFLEDGIKETLGEIKKESGIRIIISKDISLEHDRYRIYFENGDLYLKASSRIALLYAIETLLSASDSRGIQKIFVDDSPEKQLRGFHLGLPHRNRMDFAKRLFRYLLLPMRYNVIFLEFAGGMRFDRHPEISEGWLRAAENAIKGLQPFMPHSDKVSNRSLLEKSEVRELISYAKELGFEVIPEIQSLAHVQYITYAHPEIAEIDEKQKEFDLRSEGDVPPDVFYAHSYCPSNPKSYEIIEDIIDEILEVAEPREYVHMGHDEVYQIGLCKKCRKQTPAKLYATHVKRIHSYLSKKGLKMMLWSDMLHPAPVTDYKTHKAIKMIPRDIVMLDFIWYFNLERDIEDNLLKEGFKVAAGNLYSSHYPRFKSRITKEGMVGGEVSTWLICDETVFGENGKLWDVMYLSEMLWRTERYDARNRKTYTHKIAKYVQPRVRSKIRGNYPYNGYTVTPLKLSNRISEVPKELNRISENAIFAEENTTRVASMYDRIIFEHATLWDAPKIIWKVGKKLGQYKITYQDGSDEIAEVVYNRNVMKYRSSYAAPLPHQYYRHFGYIGTWFSDPAIEDKLSDGADVTVFGYVWENPHPDKIIEKITYEEEKEDFCKLILFGVKGVNNVK